MAGRIMLLDTASLYYRAFYGVPNSLKAPDGTVINALRGLIGFVSRLTTDLEPSAIVACWDNDWRPQWRVDLMATYKTHRLAAHSSTVEDTPPDLIPQVPLIAEALELLGISVVGQQDLEADDVIGTIATSWPGPVDIVTGDRDLFQLVDDQRDIRVLYTARGVSKHGVVDDAWIRSKYAIEPAQYVDFAIMRGDASDGIPGVKGIGDKTAAALLATYGDLDAIAEAVDDPQSTLTPRLRASLSTSTHYIAAAREVITVRINAFTPANYVRRPLTAAQRADFEAFSTKWGLGNVATRALTAQSSKSRA